MDYFQSIILGIVEGFSEFLPISSTAHLILTAKVLNIAQTEFVKSFEIAIQLGAILAVVWLYWKKAFLNKEIVKRILVAFLPTMVLGFLLYKIFKNVLMENISVIVWALFIGGIVLIIFELMHKEEATAVKVLEKVSYKQSFLIGIFQVIAIVPGVSRAAATIIGGLFLGLGRKTIVEFSFLLAVPTMLSATGYDLMKSGASFAPDQFGILLVGFVVSFLVAIVAVKFLLRFVQKNNFIWFGIYRVIAGLIFIFFVL